MCMGVSCTKPVVFASSSLKSGPTSAKRARSNYGFQPFVSFSGQHASRRGASSTATKRFGAAESAAGFSEGAGHFGGARIKLGTDRDCNCKCSAIQHKSASSTTPQPYLTQSSCQCSKGSRVLSANCCSSHSGRPTGGLSSSSSAGSSASAGGPRTHDRSRHARQRSCVCFTLFASNTAHA